ncbi:hypothetical protein ACFX2B_040680 [Malus domestica]
MKMSFLGPPVLMGKKDFLIALSLVANVEKNRSSYSFCKIYGLFLFLDIQDPHKCGPTGRAKTMFVAGISVGNASWPTSTQLPDRLAPVDAFCRASALLAGLSGKAEREGHSLF